MSTPTLLAPGSKLPAITINTLTGGEIALDSAGWKVIVVYRGAHCPMCRAFLTNLETQKDAFAAEGIEILAISADQADRAAPHIADIGFTSTVGVGLTVDQMRALGVFISSPMNAEEAPAPFAEPALFVINEQGTVQVVDVSNAPFARPDMASILGGIQYVTGHGYPIRGTH